MTDKHDAAQASTETAKELLLKAEGILRQAGESNEADHVWRAWQAVCGIVPAATQTPSEPQAVPVLTDEEIRRGLVQAVGGGGLLKKGSHTYDLWFAAARFAERSLAARHPQQAPSSEARDALRALVDVIEAAGVHNLSRGVELGPVAWSVKCNDALEAGHAALTREQR